MSTTDQSSVIVARARDFKMVDVVETQIDLVRHNKVNQLKKPHKGSFILGEENTEIWAKFNEEHLFDTQKVSLKHFNLFEWFPILPGKFHTKLARKYRKEAEHYKVRSQDGQVYFDPYGKILQLQGGVGAVRLLPRFIQGEPHYFMTASSNGVCHEGFPVLIPRSLYAKVKRRILDAGAAPVSITGEMAYLPDDSRTLFSHNREIPTLYLHAQELRLHRTHRSEVTDFEVSVTVSFCGVFKRCQGNFVTYATFDPASAGELKSVCDWLEQFYVNQQYQGEIITDFDEVRARFPNAKFGLPKLMAGRLDLKKARAYLNEVGEDDRRIKVIIKKYNDNRKIYTEGGTYIEGPVKVKDGKFIGRDYKGE